MVAPRLIVSVTVRYISRPDGLMPDRVVAATEEVDAPLYGDPDVPEEAFPLIVSGAGHMAYIRAAASAAIALDDAVQE